MAPSRHVQLKTDQDRMNSSLNQQAGVPDWYLHYYGNVAPPTAGGSGAFTPGTYLPQWYQGNTLTSGAPTWVKDRGFHYKSPAARSTLADIYNVAAQFAPDQQTQLSMAYQAGRLADPGDTRYDAYRTGLPEPGVNPQAVSQSALRKQIYNPDRLRAAAGALSVDALGAGDPRLKENSYGKGLRWMQEYLKTAAPAYGEGKQRASRAERAYSQKHLQSLTNEAANTGLGEFIPLAEKLVHPAIGGNETSPFSMRSLKRPGEQLSFNQRNKMFT